MISFLKTYSLMLMAVALVAALADFSVERWVALHDKTTVLECPALGTPVASLKNSSHQKIHLITLIIPSV